MLLLISFSIFLNAQLFSQGELSVSIRVSNIHSPQGNIMLAIYDSPDTFLGKQVIKGMTIPVTQQGTIQFSVKDLPAGFYAFSLYHDINSNGILDDNFFRIPKEPYGFSNNAKGGLGPPSFKEAMFEVKVNAQLVEITLK